MFQKIILANPDYAVFENYILGLRCKRILLVHGSSMYQLEIGQYLLSLNGKNGIELVEFTDFSPNPSIESTINGAKLCKQKKCDMIIACGGGSAIDVAKCIRLFVEIDTDKTNFIDHLQPGKLKLLAIPTTAGTGSEATHFAVVYKNKQKLSIGEKDNIPQAVLLDARSLEKLPLKHKKAACFDALCHAMESLWSIHATPESRTYAREAIRILMAGGHSYLSGQCDEAVNMSMLLAAHYAGKAINISKTTAAHAMSYQLTELFSIPHGQSAALCLNALLPHMVVNSRQSKETGLSELMSEINEMLGGLQETNLAGTFYKLLERHNMFVDLSVDNYEETLSQLVGSVNEERLKNHPLKLTKKDFASFYGQILSGQRRKHGN